MLRVNPAFALGQGGRSAAGGGKQAPDHSKHSSFGEGLKGVEQEAESKYKGQQREGKAPPAHPLAPLRAEQGMEGLSRLSVPSSPLPWVGTKSPAQGDTRASLGMRDGPQNSQFPHSPPLPSPLPPHCLLLRSDSVQV